jgi:hypothetical protein
MIPKLMVRLTVAAVAAVAAAGLSVPAMAVSTPLASAPPFLHGSCSQTMPADFTSSPSCESEKEQCMSASVQEGIYGEQYVPPDAVAMCMEAYRDCVDADSDSGSVG